VCVDFDVVLLELPLSVVSADPDIENVVVAPDFAVDVTVAPEEDPVVVAVVDAVLLLSCRRTMMESSSGNHLGHIGQAAAYAERYRRIIEYIWKVCEARIVK